MARHNGSVCRLCRREGGKLFLKGDRCFKEKCAFERRGYPPGSTAGGAARCRATASSCARSRRSSGCTACSNASSATTSRKRRRPRASPARPCCRCSSAGWTTSSTAWASPRRGAMARQLVVPRSHSTVNGRKVDGALGDGQAGQRGHRCARRAARTRQIKICLDTAKGRGVPPWLELDAPVPGNGEAASRRVKTSPCRFRSS